MIDKPGRSMRVLIIEDEPIIAMDLELLLLDAGYEIVGVTGRIDKALLFVESEILDAAVLDANLGGVTSAPIADALSALKVPFLVLSGYQTSQMPQALRDAPSLQKPASSAQLIETLHGMLAARTT